MQTETRTNGRTGCHGFSDDQYMTTCDFPDRLMSTVNRIGSQQIRVNRVTINIAICSAKGKADNPQGPVNPVRVNLGFYVGLIRVLIGTRRLATSLRTSADD